MLQMIVESQTDQAVVLAVYGKVAGDAVELLAQEGTRHRQTGAQLILQLDGVPFIDGAGLALLRHWAESQLTLRGGSPFLQALLAAEGLKVSQEPEIS